MENEIWKDVVGYEGYYQVSNKGNIRSIDRIVGRLTHTVRVKGRTIIPSDNGKGYLRVKLTIGNKGKSIMLHRLIATAFICNPNKYNTVNHKNGIKKDNSLHNLEWCTQSQNVLHSFRTGLRIIDSKQREVTSKRVSKMKRDSFGRLLKNN